MSPSRYLLVAATTVLTLASCGGGGGGGECEEDVCYYIVVDSGQPGLKVRSDPTADGVQWGTVHDDTQIADECQVSSGFHAGQENDVWLRMHWSLNNETMEVGESSARAPHRAFVHSAYAEATEDGEAPTCEP